MLTDLCKNFFTNFNPEKGDQFSLKIGGYSLDEEELTGELITWCYQYLNDRCCPDILISYLTKETLLTMNNLLKEDRLACGYDENTTSYKPLQLLQKTITVLLQICLKGHSSQIQTFLNNYCSSNCSPPSVATAAIKNGRKKMEDRHIVISDFNYVYSLENNEPTSFYALFDGHGGIHAACFSASQFHCILSQSMKKFESIDDALRETFLKTDTSYSAKASVHSFSSGTTALCVLYRRHSKKLYVSWLGDSQALLVKNGKLWQVIQRHSPDVETEKQRIENLGGCVLKIGNIWRVNGQLAVARAIGPLTYKPFISNEPDICCIELDGKEDFLVLACDGLWDYVSEDEIAINVYSSLLNESLSIQNDVAKNLIDLAKSNGSDDNITVIVILLKDITEIKNTNSTSTSKETNYCEPVQNFEISDMSSQTKSNIVMEEALNSIISENICSGNEDMIDVISTNNQCDIVNSQSQSNETLSAQIELEKEVITEENTEKELKILSMNHLDQFENTNDVTTDTKNEENSKISENSIISSGNSLSQTCPEPLINLSESILEPLSETNKNDSEHVEQVTVQLNSNVEKTDSNKKSASEKNKSSSKPRHQISSVNRLRASKTNTENILDKFSNVKISKKCQSQFEQPNEQQRLKKRDLSSKLSDRDLLTKNTTEQIHKKAQIDNSQNEKNSPLEGKNNEKCQKSQIPSKDSITTKKKSFNLSAPRPTTASLLLAKRNEEKRAEIAAKNNANSGKQKQNGERLSKNKK